MYNKEEYNIKYNAEKTSSINFRMLKSEKADLASFLESIQTPANTYIKALINADMVRRGYKPIFHDNRKLDSEPIFLED